MTDESLQPPERRYTFHAWTAHCATIIAAEMKRHNITIRRLHGAGVIKTRQGFKERLIAGDLRSSELADLVHYLKIDLLAVSTSFIVENKSGSYGTNAYDNLTQILVAVIELYESTGADKLLNMEVMRPAIVMNVASRILDQLIAHNDRVQTARNSPPPSPPAPMRLSA